VEKQRGLTVVTFEINSRLEKAFRDMEGMVEEMKQHEDWRARIAAMAEMRKHIAIATRALEAATRAEAVRDFEAGVLEMLAEAPVRVRRKVLGMFEARG